MWCIYIGHPGGELGRRDPVASTAPLHRPTVLHRSGWDFRKQRRGACLGCEWEGPDWRSERDAVEDAHDHCWPGWRDLPAARPSGTNYQRWLEEVKRAYPEAWLDAGGPIVTVRADSRFSRHMPAKAPGGGYDLAATYAVTYYRPKKRGRHAQSALDLEM
jgi:hypothetical protein